MQIHPSLRNIEQKWRRLNLTYVQEEEKNLTRLFAYKPIYEAFVFDNGIVSPFQITAR